MTAAMVDILSDDHLEQFYREHVAGKTSLDEDIRAIEEEIDKYINSQYTLVFGFNGHVYTE